MINKKNQLLLQNKEQGFTLVEMLAVVAVFVVVGTIASSILVTSLQLSQKTTSISTVQQNGNYVLSTMTKTLRNATALVNPFPCNAQVTTSNVTITSPDGTNMIYACGNNTITGNNQNLFDTTQVKVTSCSFVCSQDSNSSLPTIQVNFGLSQVSNSSFSEQKASLSAVLFQTIVDLRNINR